jgi:hypothetical protein
MMTPPEFFQGSISQDFPGIVDAELSSAAGKGKKSPAETGKTNRPPCSVEALSCGDVGKTIKPPCSVEVKLCKKKSPSDTGTTKRPPCSTDRVNCKKKSPSDTAKTNRPQCTDHKERCRPKKKADAFLPGVEGWSMPPAPPAF